jgi:O-antigen ligase
MLKPIRPTQRAIIFAIVLIFSGLVAGYFQWQTKQTEATFPPPPADIPLAADKGYGVTIDLTQYSPEELHATLDEMQAARLTWLRQPLRWAEIEPEPNTFNWQPYDIAIETALLRGFRLILVLDTSPPWARPEGTSPQTPPIEAADFGEFARRAALHYGNQVHHYQIWHEPNLSTHWGDRSVDATGYTRLLKNAAINIRGAQPEAKILTAALAPTTEDGPLNLNEMAYLEGMYKAKAGPWFDILAGQLYGFHLPVVPVQMDPQLLNIHRVQLLRAIMEANGDGDKPIWATAFGWHALPADWDGQPTTWPTDTPAKQRQRTAEAIDYARANWPWLGPMLAVRWDGTGLAEDDPTRGFALKPELLPAFATAAQTKPQIATLGSYPATHLSGQYSPGWGFAAGTADIPQPDETTEPARLTIFFEGTRFDLKINRGLFQGYLWVTIDEAPSEALPTDEAGRSYVVLYDPLRETDTVTLAHHLADESHVAVVEAEGGWNEWAIAGWAVYREADTHLQQIGLTIALVAAVLSGGGLVWEIGRNRRQVWPTLLGLWDRLNQQYHRLGDGPQIGLAAVLALAFYFLPGPLALLLLPLIGLAFMLRLETGLMTLSFGISFFLARKSLPVGTFSILELGLVILALATGLRLLLCLGRERANFWPMSAWLRATDWAALALLALATLSTFTAANFGVAMFELRTLVIGSVVFYGLLRLIPWLEQTDRQKTALRVADAFVAGAVLHATLALYQYYFAPAQTINAEGVRRAIGYLYGSPNNLSLFLDRSFPVLLAITLVGAGLWRRLLYGLGLLIVSGAIFLTYSKGALLLAIPVTILFLALFRGGKTGWLGAGSALILLGVALIPISRTERFQSTFSLAPGSTTFFRLKVWQSAWQMLKDHPLTGVGLDNFLYQYRTRYILPSAWQEPNLSHPHNLFLDFGTRLGFGGIIILVWLLWQFWYGAIKSYRRLDEANTKALLLGLIGSMLAFFSHGLIDNSYFLVDLAYVFFLSLGIVEMMKPTA